MSGIDARFAPQLQALCDAHRYRQPLPLTRGPGRWIEQAGQRLLNFSSNDYLGLAGDPAFQAGICEAIQQAEASFGSGAAHLLSGHHQLHDDLERALADWLGVERVLLFSTGYMANLAVQQALSWKGDWLVHDRLNHASLLDGARLSDATLKRFPHNDMTALQRRLVQCPGQAIVVTEGVFSMDGDQPHLPTLITLKQTHDAWLILDEAHAFGVLGPEGRGSFAHWNLTADRDTVRVGTLGKAFGVFGAFVAGSDTVIDTLINFGRSYIYTTALSPAQAVAALEALKAVRAADPARARLQAHILHFRQQVEKLGLPMVDSMTPIQPLVLGASATALQWQQRLRQQGFHVGAVRPPTVPRGQARLRITLSAAHTEEDIDALIDALAQCQAEMPVSA